MTLYYIWPVLDLNLAHQIKDESQHRKHWRAVVRSNRNIQQTAEKGRTMICDPRSNHIEMRRLRTDTPLLETIHSMASATSRLNFLTGVRSRKRW